LLSPKEYAGVKVRDTWYAKTTDGVHIAYQLVGDGPVDIVRQSDPSNMDFMWELRLDRAWTEAMGSVGRVILHDRRATGLSSRNVAPPNLETRVSDLELVLDVVGAEQPVLMGTFEAGAPNVLLAATHPERVHSIVWLEPVACERWEPDYPWGIRPEDVDAALRMNDEIGTVQYGHTFLEFQGSIENAMDDAAEIYAAAVRNTYTPDVAMEMDRITLETDVRGVLPAVQVPALLMAHAGSTRTVEETRYIASLMPRSEVRLMPGDSWTMEEIGTWIEEIRRFVGAEPPSARLNTVLSTVLFTDIVGSTDRQATLGDHAWKGLVERHHEVVRASLGRWRGIELGTAGDGFFATFDGPARAVRCALDIRDGISQIGMEIRAGIHTGECELIDGKIGGISVTIGSRIAATAGASEVRVSQTVKDLIAGSGLTFEDVGVHDLKGVPETWHLYRVLG
jgi:class 3 adenylate cyclase/pimeloyl-ACP methyl ester carboxylesterase